MGSKLSIITRYQNVPLHRRAIDLLRIQQTDSWIQETREPSAKEVETFEAALAQLPAGGQRETATLVLIEDLNIRSRDLARLKNEIVRHLGDTYGKFLSTSSTTALQIKVVDNWNSVSKSEVPGVLIEPIDPLHRENPQTLCLFSREEIRLDEGTTIFFSACVLPHPSTISLELKRKYRITKRIKEFISIGMGVSYWAEKHWAYSAEIFT